MSDLMPWLPSDGDLISSVWPNGLEHGRLVANYGSASFQNVRWALEKVRLNPHLTRTPLIVVYRRGQEPFRE